MSNPYTSGPYPHRVLVQLHAHTTQSDGNRTPQQVVDQYAAAGYGALAITDHDKVTAQPSGIAIPLPSNELTYASHVLSIANSYLRNGNTNTQENIDAVNAAGGLAIIAHPLWGGGDTTLAELRALSGYAGIEIHNAHCVGLSNPQTWLGVAVDVWDTLLRRRRNVWGFATDDFHRIDNNEGYDIGRIVVFPLELTAQGILDAIRRGDFVADVSNYGVTLNPPSVANSEVALDCPGASRIRFVTELGVAQVTEGSQAVYTIGGCEYYMRAEVIGRYDEAFDAAIDTAHRWGVKGGTWAVVNGVLEQQQDTDVEQQILCKRHLTGDWAAAVDVVLPNNGSQEQVGLLVNMLGHDDGYYFCLRKNSSSNPNSLTLWIKSAGAWTVLKAVPFASLPGVAYRLKVVYDAESATYACTCWAVGDTEPDPQIMLQHTQIRQGAIGFRTRRKGWFDNLSIDGFTSYYQPIAIRGAL